MSENDRMLRRALILTLLAATSLSAQSKHVVPRTPWGDPDLQGKWPGTGMMGVPNEIPTLPIA